MKLVGLHLTDKGKELILAICNRINNNRLSTNNHNLIVNPEVNAQVTELLANTVIVNKKVWAYENSILIKGSPFSNLTAAINAIGGKRQPTSIIDSGKLYLKKYSFYSQPLP